jgi:hypothetical protein
MMVGQLVNNELERIWKEMITTLFEILSQYFLRGTEEAHRKKSQVGIISVPAEIIVGHL